MTHRQGDFSLRLDWGPTGGPAVAAGAEVAVVVDVLSFTTTLTVAVERGIVVHPFRWADDRAASYASERDAVLAVGRSAPGGVSLSPASVLAARGVERLVLPSPNGSAISFALAEGGASVVGACLRNRAAVARWLSSRLTAGARVAVIAAGERWPDDSLRPAVEDLWGAGAVLASLVDLGHDDLSPEARAAEVAFRAVEERLYAGLATCASGRELIDQGFAADVDVAADLDASDVVPLLALGAFSAA